MEGNKTNKKISGRNVAQEKLQQTEEVKCGRKPAFNQAIKDGPSKEVAFKLMPE